jgi:hypothetical protein
MVLSDVVNSTLKYPCVALHFSCLEKTCVRSRHSSYVVQRLQDQASAMKSCRAFK